MSTHRIKIVKKQATLRNECIVIFLIMNTVCSLSIFQEHEISAKCAKQSLKRLGLWGIPISNQYSLYHHSFVECHTSYVTRGKESNVHVILW